MFGVDEQAHTKLRNHPIVWPIGIAVVGGLIGLFAVFVFGTTGIVWFAPLIAGPSLLVLGIAGIFLPGVTGVIGFDWNGYENWQLFLGAAWLIVTLIVPMFVLAAMMVGVTLLT